MLSGQSRKILARSANIEAYRVPIACGLSKSYSHSGYRHLPDRLWELFFGLLRANALAIKDVLSCWGRGA